MDLLAAISLNNREIAILIWILVFTVFALVNGKVRESLYKVIKAFFTRKITIPLVGLAIYTVLVTKILAQARLWDSPNIKDTTLWFLGAGIVMMINVNKATEDGYYKKIALDSLKLIIGLGVFEFAIDFYSFGLWQEILFVLFSFVIGALLGVASTNNKYKSVEKLLTGCLSFVGLVLLVYLVFGLFNDFSSLFSYSSLREYMLPAIYTITTLPYIYVFAIYVNYESVFTILPFLAGTNESTRVNKARILITFNVNIRQLRQWQRYLATGRQKHETIKESLESFKRQPS